MISGPLAQLVEQDTLNVKVVGSTPTWPTNLLKNFEVFEHTADIGLRIKGKDLNELFKSAGLALFQISSRKQFTKNKHHASLIVCLNANSLDELFINWLNELLSL